MGQISPYFRRAEDAYVIWCPGCEEAHRLPDSWQFNGNIQSPTFTPSFKHSGVKRKFVNGEWTGEWLYDNNGDPVPYICHYVLTNGILSFCGDCTHSLSGKSVPLPKLSDYLSD